jgi:hypothetical protein
MLGSSSLRIIPRVALIMPAPIKTTSVFLTSGRMDFVIGGLGKNPPNYIMADIHQKSLVKVPGGT